MSFLYVKAGRIVSEVLKKRGGIKTLTLNQNVRNKPQMYALVSETIRFRSVLEKILKNSGVSESDWKKAVRFRGVLLVMLYDFLLGKGVKGGGAVKRKLKEHEVALRSALSQLRKESGDETKSGKTKESWEARRERNELLLPAHLRSSNRPELLRYARVNTLTCTVEMAIASLRANGGHEPKVDRHIPNLLVLPAKTDIHAHPLVKTGKLILQDKASCFPAYILLDQEDATKDLLRTEEKNNGSFHVVDCCAAPGNKTSHAASIMASKYSFDANCKCNVLAFDKSPKRLELLERRMVEAGAQNIVKPCLHDFLSINTNDDQFRDVRAVLLDPSCSGTGMPQHHATDGLTGTISKELRDRARKLADFQLRAIQHAFTFPQAKRLTYSTCSILPVENERVVAAALEWTKQQEETGAAGGGWRLAHALPQWHRRGWKNEGLSSSNAQKVVRVDPAEDRTNGFFVALFVKGRVDDELEEEEEVEEEVPKEKGEEESPQEKGEGKEEKETPSSILKHSLTRKEEECSTKNVKKRNFNLTTNKKKKKKRKKRKVSVSFTKR